MQFESRTGKVIIDDTKCPKCKSYACVKACSLYGTALYRINLTRKKPEFIYNQDDLKRLCTECLGCEQECYLRGRRAITIQLPMPDLQTFTKHSR